MQETSTDGNRDAAGPLWWVAAALIAVLGLSCALVTAPGPHGTIYSVASVTIVAAMAAVVVWRRLQPFRAWATFAGGYVLLAAGDVVYDLVDGAEVSGLTGADVLWLLGSVVAAVGALQLKSAYVGEGNREALIDASSIGLAAAVLLWHPLIEPHFSAASTPLLDRAVDGAYPILDVIVVAMMLWLLLGVRRRTPTTVLLVSGSVLFLLADVVYNLRLEHGTVGDGALDRLDSLWIAAVGCYLLAVLHPSAARIERSTGSPDDRTISPGRLAMSGLTLLAPMAALGLSGTGETHLPVAIGVEVLLVVLVLLRLYDLAVGEARARQVVRDRERYFRSLVQNASEAMLVFDRSGLVADASPAVQDLLGVAPGAMIGRRSVEVVEGLDRRALRELWETSLATPDVVVTGETPVVTPRGRGWLGMRATNLLDDPAVEGIVVNVSDITARRQVQHDLERRAFTDPLTGLPNRALFNDRLEQALVRRDRSGIAVVYCDLDRFKDVNDRFGHAEGDHLLELTAERLSAVVRAEDTVARLGGDEFAVLVVREDALNAATEIADRIVEALRRPLVVGSEEVPVAISVGVAAVDRRSPADPRGVMHAADEAMYRAKRAGGDRVVTLGGVGSTGVARVERDSSLA